MCGVMRTMIAAAVWCCAVVVTNIFASAAEPHWSYQTPQRPRLPVVNLSQYAREPVDLFILAELARRNLQPSFEADRNTLLRRATLVVNGLIPTVEQVQSFKANRAPDAYEQELDRLLGSPYYGQRMASDWLDLARYADTNGFHADTEREQWRWRDWVIEQLNAGLPFDQFTTFQLAGDLLPGATLSQKIGTGFLRNNMLTDENGSIPEECLTEIALDRANTIGSVWLGQTFGCARCHDHKYEAFSQREYYGLVAFFNSLQEPPLIVGAARIEPRLFASTREQQTQLDQLAARIASRERERATRMLASAADQQRWEAQARGKELGELPGDAAVNLPLEAATDGRTTNLASNTQPAQILGKSRFIAGKFGEALLGDGSIRLELKNWPALQRSSPWTLSLWLFPTTRDNASLVAQSDDALYRRGIEWSLVDGKLQVRITQRSETSELIVSSALPIELSRWQHLAVTFDPGSPAPVQLWRNGQALKMTTTGTLPPIDTPASSPLQIGGRDAESGVRGLLDEVRFYARALSASEIQMLAGGDPLASVLRIAAVDRTAEQREALQRYYLQHHDAEYRRLSDTQQRDRTQLELLRQQAPSVLAAIELPQPRATFVLKNGQYDQPGERVSRQTPEFLSRAVPLARFDRLGFAEWLVDRRHPLTGRVGVNRAWTQVFGQGLVTTPEDFGTRGAAPAHPDLLDYLAREWVDGGWDTKRLQRRLLSSATFRQRGDISPALAAADPENRWLARGPRGRLAAEQVRDMALTAAGLVSAAHGGPGVKSYQPADLWKDLANDTDRLTAQTYARSSGGALYRRSVYLFWKRTAPPVNLTTFDAPSRETCSALRSRTNTPQQALVLLNDPTFVEAARELAARVLAEPGLSADQRLQLMMLRVLGREAEPAERAALQEQLTADLAHFAAQPREVDQLLKVGQCPLPRRIAPVELAAWANVATVLLNLDEAVTNH